MVLWKGRFSKELNHEVNAFNSSLSFDHRMYKQDIRGSLAHAKMLCKQSIIEEKDYEEIVEGLNAILKRLKRVHSSLILKLKIFICLWKVNSQNVIQWLVKNYIQDVLEMIRLH